MDTLTNREILVELTRLGIHTFSELKAYLREYKTYLKSSESTYLLS